MWDLLKEFIGEIGAVIGTILASVISWYATKWRKKKTLERILQDGASERVLDMYFESTPRAAREKEIAQARNIIARKKALHDLKNLRKQHA